MRVRGKTLLLETINSSTSVLEVELQVPTELKLIRETIGRGNEGTMRGEKTYTRIGGIIIGESGSVGLVVALLLGLGFLSLLSLLLGHLLLLFLHLLPLLQSTGPRRKEKIRERVVDTRSEGYLLLAQGLTIFTKRGLFLNFFVGGRRGGSGESLLFDLAHHDGTKSKRTSDLFRYP